jgi:hypothetical protein
MVFLPFGSRWLLATAFEWRCRAPALVTAHLASKRLADDTAQPAVKEGVPRRTQLNEELTAPPLARITSVT